MAWYKISSALGELHLGETENKIAVKANSELEAMNLFTHHLNIERINDDDQSEWTMIRKT